MLNDHIAGAGKMVPGDRVRLCRAHDWHGVVVDIEPAIDAVIVVRKRRRLMDPPDVQCVALEFLELVPGQQEEMLA